MLELHFPGDKGKTKEQKETCRPCVSSGWEKQQTGRRDTNCKVIDVFLTFLVFSLDFVFIQAGKNI